MPPNFGKKKKMSKPVFEITLDLVSKRSNFALKFYLSLLFSIFVGRITLLQEKNI